MGRCSGPESPALSRTHWRRPECPHSARQARRRGQRRRLPACRDGGRARRRAGRAHLARRPDRRSPLLVVGHSEGAWYAAQLAADAQVAGAVLLSAAARPGGDVLAWQAEQLATRLPLPVKLVLRVLRTDLGRAQRRNLERITASDEAEMCLQGQCVNARWTRDFIACDPAPALARITVPVLAITRGGDLQVPPEDVDVIGRPGYRAMPPVGRPPRVCAQPQNRSSPPCATSRPGTLPSTSANDRLPLFQVRHRDHAGADRACGHP
ncbi:alpha/beta fold hydrolase [Streptomyces sp. NPDC001732]